VIAGEYRTPEAVEDEKPLPAACAAVRQDVFTLNGSGRLLTLREPFRGWK
jgi:hypothetical protein